jgi:hypothetical protein
MYWESDKLCLRFSFLVITITRLVISINLQTDLSFLAFGLALLLLRLLSLWYLPLFFYRSESSEWDHLRLLCVLLLLSQLIEGDYKVLSFVILKSIPSRHHCSSLYYPNYFLFAVLLTFGVYWRSKLIGISFNDFWS